MINRYTVPRFRNGADLASPVSFSGSLSFDLDVIPVTNNPLDSMALPKTLNLTGVISNTLGDSLSGSLSANVTNTSTFQFFGDAYPVGTPYSSLHGGAPMIKWTYSDADATTGDDTFSYSTPYRNQSIYWNASNMDVTTSYYWNAANNNITQSNTNPSSYTSLAEAISFSGFTPYDVYTWVDGEGSYTASVASADFSVSGEVAGTLVYPEFITETDTAGGWIDADLGLTFTLQLSGLPQSVINITADRSGFQAGDAQVTISYGDRQLALSGNINNSQVNGSLTITNQDNVVLTFSDTNIDVVGSSLSGTLSLNGVEYGTMVETDSGYLRVSYNDGTFEIF